MARSPVPLTRDLPSLNLASHSPLAAEKSVSYFLPLSVTPLASLTASSNCIVLTLASTR